MPLDILLHQWLALYARQVNGRIQAYDGVDFFFTISKTLFAISYMSHRRWNFYNNIAITYVRFKKNDRVLNPLVAVAGFRKTKYSDENTVLTT